MQTRVYAFLFRWFGPLIGAYLVYMSVAAYSKTRALEASGIVVQARVVDDDGPDTRWNSIRYAFDAGGATYSYADEPGRHDAWANVTDAAYERARAEHVVAVRFHPADPWNNEPVELLASSILSRVTSALCGLACMVPGLLAWFGFALRARDARRNRTGDAAA